jgi:hypothetical protein
LQSLAVNNPYLASSNDMPPNRTSLVTTLRELVGPNVFRVVDLRDGWPSIVELQLSTGFQRFSLHIGIIHSYSRQDYEYRFQNPAQNKPVTVMPGTRGLLLGLWTGDDPSVIVAAEPEIRVGETTRFSVLFPRRLFRDAQLTGWAEPYRNNKGNRHWSFLPPLLPAFVELYESNAAINTTNLQVAAVSSGLVDDPDTASRERARQTVTRLVRSAVFGQRVVAAYAERCSMCGINLNLVAGAHILPVSADNSVDEIWNGLALCENHHRAFDSHRIWVEPRKRGVVFHPSILDHAKKNARSAQFVENTYAVLAEPLVSSSTPRSEMFEQRYEFYEGSYKWL